MDILKIRDSQSFNILIIMGYPFPSSSKEPIHSGSQLASIGLAKALAATGNQVCVICRATNGESKYQVIDNVYIHRYKPLLRVGGYQQTTDFSLSRFFLLRRLIRSNMFDLVILHTPAPLEATYCRRMTIPVIFTFQGPSGMYNSNLGKSPLELLHLAAITFFSRPLLKLTLILADNFICVIEEDKDIIHKYYRLPSDKIETIHHGIDLERFSPHTHNKLQTSFKPKDTRKNIILSLSRIQRGKGIHYLLYAAPAILNTFPDVMFIIAGVCDTPNYQTHLLNIAENLNISEHVEIINDIPESDKPDLIRASSMTVHFSDGTDPAPNSLIESLACGVPVVSVDSESRRRLVQNGVSGILVQARDVDGLSAAIIHLLSAPDKIYNMGISGRIHVESNFDIKQSVKTYLNYISRIVSNAPDGPH
ncbi:glycosyltransferase family 4 protein [candidate division KSB1 bacterium]